MSHGGGGGGHFSHGGHGGESMHGVGHGVTLGGLLGLGGHQGHSGHTGHVASGEPQETPIWNSALQAGKGDWKDRLLGMDLSPALLLGGLFLCMTIWLGIISYLRHHERGANQIFWDASKNQAITQPGSQLNAIPAPVVAEDPSNPNPANYATSKMYRPELPASPAYANSRFGSPDPAYAASMPPASEYNRQVPSVYGVPVQTAYGTRLRYTVNR